MFTSLLRNQFYHPNLTVFVRFEDGEKIFFKKNGARKLYLLQSSDPDWSFFDTDL